MQLMRLEPMNFEPHTKRTKNPAAILFLCFGPALNTNNKEIGIGDKLSKGILHSIAGQQKNTEESR